MRVPSNLLTPNHSRTKKYAPIALFCSFCITTFSQLNISFTISPPINPKAISPYIYGSNYSLTTGFTTGENFTITRVGGNRITTYNWENNASNAGSDWNQTNDRYMCNTIGIAPGNGTIPGIAITTIIDSAKKHNARTNITLQMAGYVAKDTKGPVASIAPNTRWCQISSRKGSAFSLNPDTSDNKVYMDELVNFLAHKYGIAAKGGVIAYSLDNEPDLWASTHKYAHPDATRCQELIDKSVALATAVKAIDNSAEVYGFVSFGFGGYTTLQHAPDWNDVKGKYSWFIDFYLDKINAASSAAGKRLVDVLDLHWYPEAAGDNRITSAIASTMKDKIARLQAPRTLWDPDYTEDSWIGKWFKNYLPLLPKIQSSIDTYNPGTKLAFSEIDYGGAEDITGAIAMADVLGIFGKYGVYASNYWPSSTNIPFVRLAYQLYRNYDGNNSTYGDLNIDALTTDKENSSVYASISQKSDGIMHIIAINKSMSQPIKGNFDLNNTLSNYTNASVYAITGNSTSIQKLNDIIISGNRFTCTLPALSIYHFVLKKKGSITPIPVTRITPSTDSLALHFGETATITTIVTPETATNRSINWSSSDTDVATVSPMGLLTAKVTGKRNGTASITATSEDNHKTAVCTVSITGGGECIFNTPLSSALPGTNKSFAHAYVLGTGGPDLKDFTKLVVDWDLSTNKLNGFSLLTTNQGQPHYYDLMAVASHSFSSAKPSVMISGTGLPGLDGDYFVSTLNGDFVMVNKVENFSIYFSNSSLPPNCTHGSRPLL